LQFNCNGVRNSLSELNSFLHENGVKVACLQETPLSAKTKDPSFPDFNLLRRDRLVGNGGGITILIHLSVSFYLIDTSALTQGDDVMELLGIFAKINGSPINIFNMYIPPASSCPPLYKPNIRPILGFSDSDVIVMGDLNAHHGAWHASSSCLRGDDLLSDIEDSNLCVLNGDTPM
jgi:exonuclease III